MSVIFYIGEQKRRKGTEYFVREAVRGVIINGTRVFIIKNNMGDYKFPGGGIEVNESKVEALKREFVEETGYSILEVGEEIIVTVERRTDAFKENGRFEMTSYYYLCQIEDDYIGQNLDAYEADLEFEPEWIELTSVLSTNQKILESNMEINPWVEREVIVMKYLLENLL